MVIPETSNVVWLTASENVKERTPVFMSNEKSLRNGGSRSGLKLVTGKGLGIRIARLGFPAKS